MAGRCGLKGLQLGCCLDTTPLLNNTLGCSSPLPLYMATRS